MIEVTVNCQGDSKQALRHNKVHEHIIELPLQIQGENKNKLKAIQI